MKFKNINCPFCGHQSASITYEESRIYLCSCRKCHNEIFHRDDSWDSAVEFFENLQIVTRAQFMIPGSLLNGSRMDRVVLCCVDESGHPEEITIEHETYRIPGADAVKVVRCKKCNHFFDGGCALTYGEYEPDEDDFCSRGEERRQYGG